ncbi:E3 ubiquitin-protein ligase Midline-1-like [Ochotona princeps]|uniref:E3 ubiquitin-protein ligase Midline-1-like n=1 Tax=Ochotona princeps TaxID=9978 RepID=UPI00271520A6|nr:E3 ubiquitin-protein ligase Midline-1-like [Ochotona princeps]
MAAAVGDPDAAFAEAPEAGGEDTAEEEEEEDDPDGDPGGDPDGDPAVPCQRGLGAQRSTCAAGPAPGQSTPPTTAGPSPHLITPPITAGHAPRLLNPPSTAGHAPRLLSPPTGFSGPICRLLCPPTKAGHAHEQLRDHAHRLLSLQQASGHAPRLLAPPTTTNHAPRLLVPPPSARHASSGPERPPSGADHAPSSPDHAHVNFPLVCVASITECAQAGRLELENSLGQLGRRRAELEAQLAKLTQTSHDVEESASRQEAKLVEECELLVRVIQQRRQAISTKIQEGKALRLSRLAQLVSQLKQSLERSASLAAQAELALRETDPARFLQTARELAERVSMATASSPVLLPAGPTPDAFDSLAFDFSREKELLAALDVLTVPAPPRLRPELCTASHDTVTLHWACDDAARVVSYELRYGLTDAGAGGPAPDAWLLVPDVRQTSFTVHGLQAGSRYAFRVRALNPAGGRDGETARLRTHSQPFKLDPESAHRKLRVSRDQLTVEPVSSSWRGHAPQWAAPGVAGNVVLDSGRHYWEVLLSAGAWYAVGLAYTSAPPQEWAGLGAASWALLRRAGAWVARHAGREWAPEAGLRRLGVLLDFEAGSLAFFDGSARLHVFRVTAFVQPVRPTFALDARPLSVRTGLPVPEHADHTP